MTELTNYTPSDHYTWAHDTRQARMQSCCGNYETSRLVFICACNVRKKNLRTLYASSANNTRMKITRASRPVRNERKLRNEDEHKKIKYSYVACVCYVLNINYIDV